MLASAGVPLPHAPCLLCSSHPDVASSEANDARAAPRRPLSKTVRFNMLKVIRAQGGNKKGFTGM